MIIVYFRTGDKLDIRQGKAKNVEYPEKAHFLNLSSPKKEMMNLQLRSNWEFQNICGLSSSTVCQWYWPGEKKEWQLESKHGVLGRGNECD